MGFGLRWLALFTALLTAGSTHAATSTPVKLVTNAKNVIVRQEFHPWLMVTEDLTAGRTCYYLSHLDHSKMTLKPAMPGSWMPIGSAIKWLMFVNNYQGLDRLMAHNVDYHQDFVAVPSTQRQVGCGMRGTTCVFGQYRAQAAGDHYPVDLFDYDVSNGAVTTAVSSASEKSQFAHDQHLIVYRAYDGPGRVSIRGRYFDRTGEFVIAERDGIEPSVCYPLVAWAEANGVGFDILAKNVETGETRTVAYTTANPPCPEAGRGTVFWQDARNPATAADIYGCDWDTGQEFAVTMAAGSQFRLRVCDDVVTWVTGATNYQTLWAATIEQPVRVRDLRAALVTRDSVRLVWTSVGTTSNPPISYDLRTRTDGPLTDANWSSSTPVPGLPAPSAAGEGEMFDVGPLPAGDRWFGLEVRLQDGSWTALSNVIRAYLCEPDEAFSAGEGAFVTFTGVVTGCEPHRSFYCQEAAGCRAVRVMPRIEESDVAAGQTVTVTGVLAQDADLFGLVLRQSTVISRITSEPSRAMAMSNAALGGFDARWGGTREKGAPNFWMLVKTWGRVSSLSTDDGCSFYITDGSKLADNSGRGVLVTSPYPPPSGLAENAFVGIEGISCLSRTSGRQVKVISPDGVIVHRSP